MVSGEIEPDHGKISLGYGVNMAYFAQHHSDMLDPGKTVVAEVYGVVPNESMSFVRGVCGAFLFSGKDVDKSIGVLSGGERARVALAKILVKPGNLMVMDEPTNHLDLVSSEILIDALARFRGTLLFVSHNQSFINRLANKIWDIRDGEIIEYPGRLNEYFNHLAGSQTNGLAEEEPSETQAGREAPITEPPDADAVKRKKPDRKAMKRERAEQRRLIHDTLKPMVSRVEQLEKKISELEFRQKELEKQLENPEVFKDQERSITLTGEYRGVRTELEELLTKWEYSQKELESTKKRLGV
jgi:ATP-binding cassette subfamily F protein 3